VSIEAKRASAGQLRATLTLAGEWDENVDEALEKLELAWSDLQRSPTGILLGLDQASHKKTSANLQHLTLSADLLAGPLARGLRDATSSDVREILELDSHVPGSPP
jgi:ParB-like chromosome segregation protein Spo0J